MRRIIASVPTASEIRTVPGQTPPSAEPADHRPNHPSTKQQDEAGRTAIRPTTIRISPSRVNGAAVRSQQDGSPVRALAPVHSAGFQRNL
jgi:hypothetical protein